MLVRPSVYAGGLQRRLQPGDLLAGAEKFQALATAGSGTLTAALLVGGIIHRTGPVGGYTDTPDTGENIRKALLGNYPDADVLPGISWRLIFRNTVAQTMTFGTGVEGIKYGTGTLDGTASLVREYLLTLLNATPRVSLMCAMTNASKVITFILQPGQTVLPMGLITPGMQITSTSAGAAATVVGVTQGVGGITGCTVDVNSTGTVASEAVVFSPVVRIDGIRESTL